jgi:hypothetical protein
MGTEAGTMRERFDCLSNEDQRRWLELRAYDDRGASGDLVGTLPPERRPPPPPAHSDAPGLCVTSKTAFVIPGTEAPGTVEYEVADELWEFLGRELRERNPDAY